jgi:hypothetical protein
VEVAERKIENVPHVKSGKAIRAYDGIKRVFLWQIETAKDYKCYDCRQKIPGSIPHTFLRYLFPDDTGFDHHHIHNACARENWLARRITQAEIIPLRKVPLRRRRRKRGE